MQTKFFKLSWFC